MNALELDGQIGELYQEGVFEFIDKVITKIKLILSKMKEAYQNLKKEIINIANHAGLKAKLKKMRKEIQGEQKRNRQTVRMVDYPKFLQVFNRTSGSVMRHINKLSDYKKFRTADAFLAAVHELEREIDYMDNELSKVESNPVETSIAEALSFIEDNILGESKVMHQYVSCHNKLQGYINRYERCLRDARATSNWFMTEQYANAFQRSINKCTKTFNKHAGKIVALTVFKFA